jgi:hypothetical protein
MPNAVTEELEGIAGRLVAHHTNVSYAREDPGGGKDQLADFSLWQSDVCVGLLEVTAPRDEGRQSFMNAAAKSSISIENSRSYWFLCARSVDVRVQDLERALPPLLRALEELEPGGMLARQVHDPLNQRWVQGVLPESLNRALYGAGLDSVSFRPTEDGEWQGTVHLQPPAVGGAVGPDLVTVAVQRELERGDNKAKLGKAPLGGRSELFVWVLDGMAALAMTTPLAHPNFAGGYLGRGPQLPSEITRVWAAALPQDVPPFAGVVWQASGADWEMVHLGLTPE